MKIGVLSDTHGFLPPQVFEHFNACDEIWHAGDIGSMDVAEKLAGFKPMKMVYGNIDGMALRQAYPHTHTFECNGLRVFMTHIAGQPPFYNSYVKKVIQKYKPHILVSGHTHILRVERDKKHGILYINPGAVGHYGIHLVQTMLRFAIIGGKPTNMEVIQIGKRRV